MLTLVLGRSGAGKSAYLLHRIADQAGVRRQVLIVPEQYSHDMERRLCAAGGDGISLSAEVLSFTRLASRVFSSAGGAAAPVLDAGGRLLLMRQAVQEVADRLKVYQRPSRKPAFLTGLIATADELKSCCVTPEQLWQAGEASGGGEGDKLSDLALILGAYQAFTAQQGADPRDRLTRLAAALGDSGWARGMDCYLDGFTDFTPQERQVIARLLEQCASVTVALTCDHLEEDEGGCGVFSPARRTARQLLELARRAGVPQEVVCRQIERDREPALAALEGRLAGEEISPWDTTPRAVRLMAAHTPYSEVEWAAAEILRLVREEGYRFRDIAVAARSMEGYGQIVENLFARYGIPVFLSRMSDILQKPVLALITAALDTVAGDYRYEDVFRYLKTGLADVTAEECDILENYVLKWGLRGGRWTQKKDWTMHPRGYGLPLSEEDRALLQRLDALRRRVAEPLERLRRAEEKTGRGRAVALYRFLEDIELPQRLDRRSAQLLERGEPALAAEYGQLWDILCASLEQCAQILGEVPMELEEFAKLFSLVLSQYDVGSIPVSLDRVIAADMPRLAHKPCKALFLLGVDDASIPQVAPSPGLLNDDDRSLLASFGMELAPGLSDKLYREHTILYETCALPDRRLYVSWAVTGGEGEERRPAHLAAAIRALFPALAVVREGELDGLFRLAAPRPALELAGRYPAVAQTLGDLAEYAGPVQRMEQAACLVRGQLSRRAVEALYGREAPMSASRMDKYKSCHFSYFMQYGLRAQARKPAGFQAPEYGTFVHYVLEHVLQEYPIPQRGDGLAEQDRAGLREKTEQVVERYVREELGGLEQETPRFQYLFRRLLKPVYAVVENAAEELACSDFRPVAFELGFGKGQELPPVSLTLDGLTVSLSGFVDRVDGWVKGDKLYLKVVDYKTGRKSFDLTDIWNGLGLQMLIYLFTLKGEGAARFGHEIVPAGVSYLPARDAVVAGSRGMTEEERRRKMDAQLRRKGLLLDDPEVLEAMEHPGAEGVRFLPVKVSARTGRISGPTLASAERLGRLERHTGQVLREIVQELAAGVIAADPFWRGPEQNACRWCDYRQACQFEEGRGGDKRRWLPSLSGEAFWAAVERQEQGPPRETGDGLNG